MFIPLLPSASEELAEGWIERDEVLEPGAEKVSGGYRQVELMGKAKRLALILAVSAGGVALDRAAKAVAQALLSPGEMYSFLGDTFRLQLAHNRGAFLSLGHDLPDLWRQLFFNAGVVALLLCLMAYAVFSRRIRAAGVWASALVVSGGLGNLIDRFLYEGRVVDFMNFGIGPVRTGIVNLADIFITAGVVLLFADELRHT